MTCQASERACCRLRNRACICRVCFLASARSSWWHPALSFSKVVANVISFIICHYLSRSKEIFIAIHPRHHIIFGLCCYLFQQLFIRKATAPGLDTGGKEVVSMFNALDGTGTKIKPCGTLCCVVRSPIARKDKVVRKSR